ncbi:MAG TPA: hypothetical protein VJ385_16910 [Fibrobacteria bacterium]|nr:hypothetical protein [Fibrobacteria bacterium]
MKLPHHPFFLFGMGNRRKLLYKAGALYDALTGELLRSWNPSHEQILPHEYAVKWHTKDGKIYSLREDETGVCLRVEGTQTYLTGNPIRLPDFKGSSHANVLKVLLHEVLVNVLDGKPLANFLVQAAPTYRDGAIICECLRRTGNLGLVKDWILGLREPFDYAREGEREPDNLGQALFLISLVSDKEHPLVAAIQEQARAFRNTDYIDGRTDASEHPVYQTKWLKFGLKSLGLGDPYKIPVAFDPYASVFWMDYKDISNNGPPFPEKVKEASPHLAWAEAHFHGWDPPMPVSSKTYPLSWEIQAERNEPHGMSIISPEFVDRRITTPQARHASEMLLYYLDKAPSGLRIDPRDEQILHVH